MSLWLNAAPHMWYVAFRFLLLLIQIGLIVFSLCYFGIYFAFKIALKIKPNGGYKGDAQSIVSQAENQVRKIKEYILSMLNK